MDLQDIHFSVATTTPLCSVINNSKPITLGVEAANFSSLVVDKNLAKIDLKIKVNL